MNPSYATVNPNSMELTPCRVTFKGVDLGGTLGNVAIKPVYEKAEIKADQFGTTVLNRKVKGVKLTIETQLAEVKNKDNWMAVFPNLRDTGSGAGRVVDFTSKVGSDDLSLAGPLLLHPLSLPDSDVTNDFSAPLAASAEESEYILSPEGQTVLKIVWNIYLDTSVTPAFLARFGNQAIVVTGGGIQAFGQINSDDTIVFTSVAAGPARNTQTLTFDVVAAEPNPSNLVIAAFSGSAAAILCTITPNDGTNNGAVPVSITEKQLVELFNTGAVVGKSMAISDPLNLRKLQTAAQLGAGSTSLVAGGPVDGQVCTFAGGA